MKIKVFKCFIILLNDYFSDFQSYFYYWPSEAYLFRLDFRKNEQNLSFQKNRIVFYRQIGRLGME